MTKKKTAAKTVKTGNGGIFNLKNAPVGLGEINETDFAVGQKALNTLPDGEPKTTLSHIYAKAYGFYKSREWLSGITGGKAVSA